VATILEDLLAGRLPGLLGDGSQVWNYVHVVDAARGHRLALERGERGRDYLLGGENRSLRDFLELAASLAGVEAPRRRVPFAVLGMAARLEVGRARLTGRTPTLTPGMVDCYRHHWAFSDRRARHELGYRGRLLEEGLRETVDWLRRGGISPFRDDTP
jgi:nucleoside-diphosphate-sugar epimerase